MRPTATTILLALATATAAVLGAPGIARAVTPWCGNDQLATDRVPDAVGGHQVHVVYAIPSDGADRFAAMAAQITTDIAAIDAWWRREDPSRAPRFDVFPFPGCPAGLGQLDLSFVRLAQPSSAYHPYSGRLERLATDLGTLGLSHRFKKYVVYYDGVVEPAAVCGTAFRSGEQGGFGAVAAVWVQSHPGQPGCGTVGLEDYAAKTAAHELLHQLGAVPDGAPSTCPGDAGHSCDDARDVMQGGGSPFSTLAEHSLDVGRNDYYGHSGGWLDVQDSAWLNRLDAPDFPLTVTRIGAGAEDTVESDLPGIVCPPACATMFESGAKVELEATVGDEATRFVAWRGACTGRAACEVVLDADKRVDAVFGPASYRIGVRVVGRGRVTTIGFSCARRCTDDFAAGETVRFRARPARGWRFVRWSGACRGRTICRVAVNANRQLTATFRRA